MKAFSFAAILAAQVLFQFVDLAKYVRLDSSSSLGAVTDADL